MTLWLRETTLAVELPVGNLDSKSEPRKDRPAYYQRSQTAASECGI